MLKIAVHLPYGFVHHLLVICPRLRVEVRGTGFFLHLPVREVSKVKGATCSSRGILTETFQRDEAGNVEGRSLTQFPCDGSELTYFGNDFLHTTRLYILL